MVGRLHRAERETLGSFTVRDLIERTSGAAAATAPARDSERAVGDT